MNLCNVRELFTPPQCIQLYRYRYVVGINDIWVTLQTITFQKLTAETVSWWVMVEMTEKYMSI